MRETVRFRIDSTGTDWTMAPGENEASSSSQMPDPILELCCTKEPLASQIY